MATIVNNPPPVERTDNSGWVLGLIVLIVLVLLAVFLLPRLSANYSGTNTYGNTTNGAYVPASSNVVVPPVINTTVNSTTTTSNPPTGTTNGANQPTTNTSGTTY